MPITIGLPALDRSIFGLRKTDRASNSPSPVPNAGSLLKNEDVESPPELPPLGVSNWHSSFTNLLDQIEVSQSVKISRNSIILASIASVPAGHSSASPSSETVQQHDAISHEMMDSVELMTTDPRNSAVSTVHSSGIPARQQSSTSSTSLSKRSNSLSVQSASSRSSVENITDISQQCSPTGEITIQSLNTSFLTEGFLDTNLDLELNSDFLVNSPTSSVNTNKPLPPAPAAAVRDGQAVLHGIHVPELDSAPISKVLLPQNFVRHVSGGLDSSKPKSMPTLRLSEDLRTSVADGRPSLEPPRRNTTRRKPKSQKSKIILTKKVSPDMAEQVILRIFLNLNSVVDIQATALVNKGFYRVFKRHESHIVENVQHRSSEPAWELRQLVKREQKRNPFQMKAVQRDLAALRALQAFMLMKCDKICRKTTMDGLVGNDPQRRAEIENALWRIWTFCKLFGKGSSRDTGAHAQMQWLESKLLQEKDEKTGMRITGYAKGPTRSELEDMSEMWRCMELLLSGFRGREPEAREAGIFDQCKIDDKEGRTETQYLEDWIYDILSVGPKAVLTMISCSFEHAKVLGVNKWTPPRPGRGRRSFLKAALEQVYRDRLVEEARLEAENFARSMQQQTGSARSRSDEVLPTTTVTSLPQRATSESLSLATDQQLPQLERLEIRPDCDPQAALPLNHHQIPTTSPTTNPAAFSSLAMMSNASTRMGATLFPIQSNTSAQQSKSSDSSVTTSAESSVDLDIRPAVVDPIDRAMSLLVKQLGFPVNLARQALAMSDDGAGIDVQRAVELLSEDRRLEPKQKEPQMQQLPELPGNSPKPIPAMQQIKGYCEGTCRRVSLLHRRKSNLRSLISRHSLKQGGALDAIMEPGKDDSAVQHLVRRSISPTFPVTMPTVYETSAEPKSVYRHLEELVNHRSNLRPHDSIRSPSSLFRGHTKSSSTGTIEFSDGSSTNILSPVSPITPALGLGGFTTIIPQPQHFYDDDESNHLRHSSAARPKVTLTRVGTGKRPSKRISLTKHGLRRTGEPPEIIGYTY